VRDAEPALRYGRLYFRPVSGDGNTFGISPFPDGVFAWSRILNDQEVIIAANTNPSQAQSVDVVLEMLLSGVGDNYRILYSNKANATPPEPVANFDKVTVYEVDGSAGHGPLHAIRVTLGPMEVQILRH